MLTVMRRRFWRGSAPLFGVLLLAGLATAVLASWHGSQAALFRAERDRERGRLWGMTCAATYRAVQAGFVTAAGTVTPAQLSAPGTGFAPFLPAGIGTADQTGALTARYGAIVVGGTPVAVCSLSGAEIDERYPELREGAAMGGIDLVGFVGGDDTAMHARLTALQAQLGTLANGSMFVTSDFGIAHPAERLHRRAVGGRPELARMAQAIAFAGGVDLVGAGTVSVERAEADEGEVPDGGDAEVEGDAVVASGGGSLALEAATEVEADGGFAFGGTQAAFTIPGELAVGASMRSRGAAAAATLTLDEDLEAGGDVEASGSVSGNAVETDGEASALSGSVSGALRVDSCNGCDPPSLGP